VWTSQEYQTHDCFVKRNVTHAKQSDKSHQEAEAFSEDGTKAASLSITILSSLAGGHRYINITHSRHFVLFVLFVVENDWIMSAMVYY
jgi:hypothetical protein